jgi:hypothetical protein
VAKKPNPLSRGKRKKRVPAGLGKKNKIITVRFGPGREKERPSGGGYEDVRAFNQLVKKYKLSFEREADHTPPKSTYKDTPYAWLSDLEKPAVSIEKEMHRKGVTTTGSYEVSIKYREGVIHRYLKAGNFKAALIESFKDQKNAAPHWTYYAVSQAAAARYARSLPPSLVNGKLKPLLNDRELAEVLKFIPLDPFPAPAFTTSFQNSHEKFTREQDPFLSRPQVTKKVPVKVDGRALDPVAGSLTESEAARRAKSSYVPSFSSSFSSSSSSFSSSVTFSSRKSPGNPGRRSSAGGPKNSQAMNIDFQGKA